MNRKYNKILLDNATKTNNKVEPPIPKKSNMKAKIIVKIVQIEDKTDIRGERQSFVMIKHTTRTVSEQIQNKDYLIQPKVNQIGSVKLSHKASTHILQQNQWQGSAEVIKWFKNIENKNLYTFTIFDIQQFYPSIIENLLKRAISFYQLHKEITPKDLEEVFHSRKS